MRAEKIKKQILLSAVILSMVAPIPAQAYMSSEANSLYQQACTLEYQHNLPEAVNKLNQAIQLAGDEAMLYTKLAGIYTDMDEYDKAVETYLKVIQLRPMMLLYILVLVIFTKHRVNMMRRLVLIEKLWRFFRNINITI